MSMKTLSVIVPVYNGASYIRESLGSLIDQANGDVEVIVVDDGSLDETSPIIRQCFAAALDNGTLRLLEQANQGVSEARNHGLDQAKGRFIGFMDADDFVLPGYVLKIIESIRLDVDVIEFGFRTFVNSVDECRVGKTLYSNDRFGVNDMPDVIDRAYGLSRWYPWSRVFRASLFDGIRFPVGVRFCEDLMTIPLLYEKSTRQLGLSEALYGYRTNPSSATFNVRPDYVGNLEQFYRRIPRQRLARHDYLRMSVAYAIHSCKAKAGDESALPAEMADDMRRLRFSPSVYRHVQPRRIALQLYPSTYKLIQRLARVFR